MRSMLGFLQLFSTVFQLAVALNSTTETLDISAARSERDVAFDVPIDEVTMLGMSVSQVVFGNNGYTERALDSIQQNLQDGLQTLVIDYYWNELLERWQLCPGPISINNTMIALDTQPETQTVTWRGQDYVCQWNMTVDSLILSINSYIMGSNTNMNANVLHLILNLHLLGIQTVTNSSSSSAVQQYNSSVLRLIYPSSLLSPFQLLTSLYTPVNQVGQTATGFYSQKLAKIFPTIREFILEQYKRILVTIAHNYMLLAASLVYQLSTSDNNTLFDSSIVTSTSTDNNTLIDLCENLGNFPMESVTRAALDQNFRLVFDSKLVPFTNSTLRTFARCGFTPVLNSSTYGSTLTALDNSNTTDDDPSYMLPSEISTLVVNAVPYLFWSWAVGQPSAPDNYSTEELGVRLDVKGTAIIVRDLKDHENRDDYGTELDYQRVDWDYRDDREDWDYIDDREDDYEDNYYKRDSDDDDDNPQDNQVAYKCVFLVNDGWSLGNCYSLQYFACQNTSNPMDWVVQDKKKNYFEAALTTENMCPTGYDFLTPHLGLETIGLITYINNNHISYPVWININDLTVPSCFVTGGALASCPYQKMVSTATLVRMIAPEVFLVAFFVLLIILEKIYRRQPIQRNRKKFYKKSVMEYMELHDTDGVPS